MATHFAGAQLVERQGAKLRFRLPTASMPIGKAFELMQTNQERMRIQEYSLSQTTLEQIFNQFAAEQEEETQGAHGIVAQAQPQVPSPRVVNQVSGTGPPGV